jgi:hypothetical protein
LQALVEAKCSNFEKKVYAWDTGSPVSLIEIARKMAYLYGCNPDLDLAFKYMSQPVETGLMSPEDNLHTTFSYPSPRECYNEGAEVTPEAVKSVFKDFVNLCHNKPSFQDWRIRTGELLGLCTYISR